MNCFQIIKSVLDEEYNQIPGNESEKDRKIKDKLEELRREYTQLLDGHNISYSNHITRFAYVYAYVTSHANLVYALIEQNQELQNIFNREKAKITCIGGGPGSDFLGIIKYITSYKKSPDLKVKILDREKTWEESWDGVDDKVERTFSISTSFLPLDVTIPDDWKDSKKYFQSDFFTMIYFMSELLAVRDSANEYFLHLFSKAKPGSLFLFVDNNYHEFYDWFDELAVTQNIDIIKSQETRMVIPSEEDKSDLGIYFDKFTYPKLRANVAYRIGRKK